MSGRERHLQYDRSVATLDDALTKTAAALPYTEVHYPALGRATRDEQIAFAVRHSALHLAKTAGELAALSEANDHGRSIDTARLRRIALKAVINAMRLSVTAGLRPQDIMGHLSALSEANATS